MGDRNPRDEPWPIRRKLFKNCIPTLIQLSNGQIAYINQLIADWYIQDKATISSTDPQTVAISAHF